MLSPTTTMRTGLYGEAINGVGLQGTELQAVRDGRDDAATLAQSIRDALALAREQGLSAFEPDTGTLQVPSSIPTDELRGLFAVVIGHPYQAGDEALYPGLPAYGPLSLAQWSQAEADLAVYVARQDSLLPPAEGGGPKYARGRWFVNGEPYTTAELLLTVRMGTLGELDRLLATDLNTMVANTTLAQQLLDVLAHMKRRRDLREMEAAAKEPPADEPPGPKFLAGDDYADFVVAAGLSVPELMELGERFKGPDSYLLLLGSLALDDPTNVVASTDYDGAMDELQSLFDSVNSENDVKKLRVDTLHNARLAVLEGMSSFLGSNVVQQKTVARNL